jgi:MoaA/NifB/PqqE/SkfB family radical SAM enzyme
MVSSIAAMVDLSGKCNSHCLYCADWKNKLSTEIEFDAILSLIDDFHKMGIQVVCFSGGEPLLYQPLEKTLSFTKALGISPWIITNGILLTNNRLERLLHHGLECCLLSIDSLDPTIYKQHRGVDFRFVARALANLEYAKSKSLQLSVVLNCVITRKNFLSIFDLLNFASEKGFYVLFQPYESRVISLPPSQDPFLFTVDDLRFLEPVVDQLVYYLDESSTCLNTPFFLKNMIAYLRDRTMPPNYSCDASELTVCIGNNGEYFPCWHMKSVGNVHHNSILKLYESKEMQLVRNRMRALVCPTCWTSCHIDMLNTIKTLSHKEI